MTGTFGRVGKAVIVSLLLLGAARSDSREARYTDQYSTTIYVHLCAGTTVRTSVYAGTSDRHFNAVDAIICKAVTAVGCYFGRQLTQSP